MNAEPQDFDLVAASLRADSSERGAFVEGLAHKLERALPDLTRVERKPRRLLSKQKVVHRIEVELGENRYSIALNSAGAPEAQRSKAVRGIVLKSEPLPLDRWIDALSHDLAREAAASAEGRSALERLLM